MTPFGLKLRELRNLKSVTQKKMAQDLNISAAYLSALEHGKRGVPSWQMLQRIIHYFNIIWDEAEELVEIAGHSRTKTTINTIGLSPKANILANRFAAEINRLDEQGLDKVLAVLDGNAATE
ncbi:MAG: helix-turn-helix domain-containing protein [Alphaproteobacteria bacterium]|nr:helix-turn-helix domain-containing protein [Alphaproteobacteria bacterium]